MTGTDWGIVCAGVVALTGAVLAVASRVLLHAVTMFVVAAFGVAAAFVALGSPVAGALLLVTAVVAAVAVLLVTAGVTRAPFDRHDDFDVSWARRAGALGAGVAAAALLSVALVETTGWHRVAVRGGGVAVLAHGLLGTWWWAFLVAAVLAATALVAALMLPGREGDR